MLKRKIPTLSSTSNQYNKECIYLFRFFFLKKRTCYSVLVDMYKPVYLFD